MAGSQDEIKEPPVQKPGVKKPYSKPELIVHGTVEKITEQTRQGHQTENMQQNRSPT
ncbi:MAG TPA: hypothetical protein VMC85_23070 [Desulfomonilaceae bacterium]|nr:hypothetical protein [Desulfomonilaceae bacterium]